MKNLWKTDPVAMAALGVCLVFAGVTFVFSWPLAVAELAFLCGIVAFELLRLHFHGRRVRKALTQLSTSLSFADGEAAREFPLPFLVAESSGRVLWYNELFRTRVLGGKKLEDASIGQFTSGIPAEEILAQDSVPVEYDGLLYTVFANRLTNRSDGAAVFYFVDDTQLKKQAEEYRSSRPAVLLVAMDSLDEIAHGLRDSEKAALTGGVEKIIETWSSQFDCVMRKYANSRYILVVEERSLQTMMQQRFNVLDHVRAYTYEDMTGVTLSIGVGRGDSLHECEDAARQALDMALGRGGDQAAVNTHGQFTFYGGVSQSVEKQTKVRTRIVASAIAELFEGSDTILIMGHRFADLDALGAAAGIWSAARFFKKPAYIVMSRAKSLAKVLTDQLDKGGMRDFIIEPGDALQRIGKRTLLVVVDTHRPDFVEYPPLLDKIQTVIVIDHHRKTVNFIDHAVIFYHEPTASSASEMVTELLPYMSRKPFIDKLHAEALLAGIMLDTRNFVLRTGVHTFEAAAYLRGRGADTVCVKQLFSNSMEDYHLRNAVTASFDTYRGCAIAIADIESEDIRVIASQAADELLNISGIRASYVLYRTEDVVNISARSMGAMNVQLIMEMLGGGGHQTMAAAQLKNISVSEAKVRLLQGIDQFYAQMNTPAENPDEQSGRNLE